MELIDLADPTFRTLAAHPEVATDWLFSSTSEDRHDAAGQAPLAGDAGRIEYWFTERNWAVSGSGFRAPLALQRATQDPSLRRVDPSTGELADPQAWVDAAVLMTQTSEAMIANEHWSIERLTPREATILAETLDINYAALHTAWTNPGHG